MAPETEFVTAPSTPEPSITSGAQPPPPSPSQPDTLQIVVEQRLRHHDAGDVGGSSSMTIFRVPAHVRDANKELYEPRLVSIGPYYRDRGELRAMEQHKWRYLHELLSQYPNASLADCVRAVRDVEHHARRCYSERTDIFDDNDGKFAEMLLLDASFVLQFFIKWYKREPDKLCDVGWGLPLLHSDLLLMENQIPFFVLEAIFHALSPESNVRLSLLKLIVPKFNLHDSTLCKDVLAGVVPTQVAEEVHHLLHLLYEAFMPTAEELEASSLVPDTPDVAWLRHMWLWFKTTVSERFAFLRDMPCVPGCTRPTVSMTTLQKLRAWFSKFLAMMGVNTRAEPPPEPPTMVVQSVKLLREAGVRFEKKASPRHMFDVTFDAARGVLRMPRVKVDYADKAQLVNLIAFEQTRGGLGANAKLLSSYAALVTSLVRTAEDVEHLQKHDVIDNLLSSDDDAATKFFQHLGDCSSLDYAEHHFAAMFTDLSKYYHSSWQRHKAKFLRDHCSSPWAVLAFVLAGCVFCFALVKFSTTIYSLSHPYCHC